MKKKIKIRMDTIRKVKDGQPSEPQKFLKFPKGAEMDIEFASQTVIDALEPYVNQVLKAIAQVLDMPGIAGAWVSDESAISDFMETTASQAERAETRGKISAILGVPIERKDYIYEVALRLKRREESAP